MGNLWTTRQVRTYSHISCTFNIGPAADSMAVTDQFGNVYGMEGPHTIDVTIGERIADLIR